MPEEVLVDPLLLSNFVHQIINPLSGVVGTLDNILDGTIRDPDKRQQRLKAVHAQLKHAIELVRNLAFLSELSSTHGNLVFTERASDVLLPRIIIEAAQVFQEVASSRDIKIELIDSQIQYTVKGHEGLLRQVFMNLFDNAVKYADFGTRVTINAHGQKHTDHLIVEVASVGAKLDYEEKARVFDLGFRGRAAQEIKASGSGLGLYIARRILELAHAATIEAEPAPNIRTTVFRLRFPSYRTIER